VVLVRHGLAASATVLGCKARRSFRAVGARRGAARPSPSMTTRRAAATREACPPSIRGKTESTSGGDVLASTTGLVSPPSTRAAPRASPIRTARDVALESMTRASGAGAATLLTRTARPAPLRGGSPGGNEVHGADAAPWAGGAARPPLACHACFGERAWEESVHNCARCAQCADVLSCRFLHRRVEGVKARPTRQKIGHSDNRRVL
jgi:hypothetical protein